MNDRGDQRRGGDIPRREQDTERRGRDIEWREREEEERAGREASEIGGRVPEEEGLDPAQRARVESGGGVAEGFELAEEDLIEHATHGDEQSARPAYHHRSMFDEEASRAESGEADSFRSSEVDED